MTCKKRSCFLHGKINYEFQKNEIEHHQRLNEGLNCLDKTFRVEKSKNEVKKGEGT